VNFCAAVHGVVGRHLPVMRCSVSDRPVMMVTPAGTGGDPGQVGADTSRNGTPGGGGRVSPPPLLVSRRRVGPLGSPPEPERAQAGAFAVPARQRRGNARDCPRRSRGQRTVTLPTAGNAGTSGTATAGRDESSPTRSGCRLFPVPAFPIRPAFPIPPEVAT